MKVGVIGAGNVGSPLARASVRAGHTVIISATDPEHATKVATASGATAAKNNADAVSDAAVVILAVPYDAVSAILSELDGRLDGTVLVDVSNRFAPDRLNGLSNAEQIQQQAGRVPVVKAFNTIFAAHQDTPSEDGMEAAGPHFVTWL